MEGGPGASVTTGTREGIMTEENLSEHILRPVENIGARVKRLRIERNISQDRLAIEAHVDQSGLSKFERGARTMGSVPLRRIATVLGVTLQGLVDGTDFTLKG